MTSAFDVYNAAVRAYKKAKQDYNDADSRFAAAKKAILEAEADRDAARYSIEDARKEVRRAAEVIGIEQMEE